MRREGIYNEESCIDATLERKLQGSYKDWETNKKFFVF
jgi:hypothetical protein